MRIMPPVRASHSYTQRLAGRPEEVFPLLCPVRETEWVEGWSPGIVVTHSGVAERDCVFTTTESAGEAVWVITEHDARSGLVEMVKVVPGFLVTRLRIDLRAIGRDETEARVAYIYTAITEEGNAFVRGRTEEEYARFMRTWEAALNRRLGELRSGKGHAPDSSVPVE